MTLLGILNNLLCIPFVTCPLANTRVVNTNAANGATTPDSVPTVGSSISQLGTRASSLQPALPATTLTTARPITSAKVVTASSSTPLPIPSSIAIPSISVASSTAAKPSESSVPLGTKYWPGWSGIENIFAFGNSYTTTTFNPNGPQPSKQNPIGNPAFPGVTSSGGLNWLGCLTGTYNESTILTYNLASGGATVDADLVKPFTPSVKSLKEQVEQEYIPIYGKKPSLAPWVSSNTLHAFWLGINDVGNSYLLPDVNEDELFPKIFAEYATLVEEIYKTGARNFLFLNVPSVDRSPVTRTQANVRATSLENLAIVSWNTRLDAFIAKFKLDHPDVTAFRYDTFSVFNLVLDNPKTFQQTDKLTNLTDFCPDYQNGTPAPDTLSPSCRVPVNQYFWLNALHPTPAIHNLIATKIVSELKLLPKTVGTVRDAPSTAGASPNGASAQRKLKRENSRLFRRTYSLV